MLNSTSHFALFVPDLQEAERFYKDLIGIFQPDKLEFIDPYHITWQIAEKPLFRTAGDSANRWIFI